MTIIADTNTEYAKTIQTSFSDSAIINCSGTTQKIAEAIASAKDVSLILINAEATFDDSKMQELKGIELLTWLRVKRWKDDNGNYYFSKCPIVLYGFLSVPQILSKNPKHIIIHAPGNTYIQLPFVIDGEKIKRLIENNPLQPLTNEDDEKYRAIYRLFVKPVFEIETLRHQAANVYGLEIMVDAHNYVSDKSIRKDVFNCSVSNIEISQLQMNIAEFLRGDIHRDNDANEIKKKICVIRERIKDINPKILYIDDKAHKGWATLLKIILYNTSGKVDEFQSIVPLAKDFENENPTKQFIELVTKTINNSGKHIDCLILDLRLQDEKGLIENVETLSGVKLLKIIHGSFPSLPIIIFSASNKAHAIKKVIDMGAETLWTKPGLDEFKSNEQHLLDYLEFVQQVEQAVTKFKLPIEKWLYTTDFEIEELIRNEKKILSQLQKKWDDEFKYLKYADIILLDTNLFMEHEKRKLTIDYQKIFFLLCLIAKAQGKQINIIDDVRYELFRKTKLGNEEEKVVSTYSLNKIYTYSQLGYSIEDAFYLIKNTQREIGFSVSKAYNDKWILKSEDKKIVSIYETEDLAREAKERRKGEITKGKDLLHADDTFKLLILHYLNTGKNVLFVSDDNRCKDEIFNILKNENNCVEANIFLSAKVVGQNLVRDGYVKLNNKSCRMIPVETLSEHFTKNLYQSI